jgi:hypothetical protein
VNSQSQLLPSNQFESNSGIQGTVLVGTNRLLPRKQLAIPFQSNPPNPQRFIPLPFSHDVLRSTLLHASLFIRFRKRDVFIALEM